MFWIGSKTAIARAEKLAWAEVSGQPETIDGVEVPDDERITSRWATPAQTASGCWAIPAHPDLAPDNVELVEAVDWPEPEGPTE